MPRVKQLTLSHENLPGMLASIAKVLGKENVNILSCLTMTSGTTGTTRRSVACGASAMLTGRVRRRTSRNVRSITLVVRIFFQTSSSKSI